MSSNLCSTHSTSQTSLVSNASFNSVATTSTLHNTSFSSNATATSKTGNSNVGGVYTALCVDSNTNKILAAKCDKQKTVIEIYNSNCTYEYSIESSQNEKALKRVTSMSCTNDGRVVCVDLCSNLIKMFRFTQFSCLFCIFCVCLLIFFTTNIFFSFKIKKFKLKIV